ncbi:interferon gamma 1 [Engraulis encrasicolus]|uniref:interferon gamma 1 n=1 Tax=Engraulis encrasicolus TaxID=184585 RepID=UPI002FD54D71
MASASSSCHPCSQHQHHLSRVMVVALGILCVMSGQLATAKAETFPKNMADRLTSLKTYLKHDAMPSLQGRMFLTEKADAQESGDKILAGESLKFLSKILSAMQSKIQNQTTNSREDKKASEDLQYLKSKIDELRREYFNKDHQKMLDNLKKLQQTDVNDEQVQEKALFELKHVYNHASRLAVAEKTGKSEKTMRRRRQIRPLRKAKP